MRNSVKKMRTTMLLALGVIMVTACSGDISQEAAPVTLVATVEQSVTQVDLVAPPTGSLGSIILRNILKTQGADTRFLDIQLRTYRVSYVRTDGGRVVPNTFVESVSGIVPIGGSPTTLNTFKVFDVNATNQAPFAALLPQNGNRDPETGQSFVKLDVIMEIFGETLSGENVSARVRFPLTFCAGCGSK